MHTVPGKENGRTHYERGAPFQTYLSKRVCFGVSIEIQKAPVSRHLRTATFPFLVDAAGFPSFTSTPANTRSELLCPITLNFNVKSVPLFFAIFRGP